MTVYPRLRMRTSLEERELPVERRHRVVEGSDATALGGLLLAAYGGTVDDEGETREDADTEIEQVLDRLPDIELAGDVQRLRSNFINGIKHMPVTFTPSR